MYDDWTSYYCHLKVIDDGIAELTVVNYLRDLMFTLRNKAKATVMEQMHYNYVFAYSTWSVKHNI